MDRKRDSNGVPPDNWETHRKKIWRGNLSKLSIWCAVGRDIQHGIWAIAGARQGLCDILDRSIQHTFINDYTWFANKWNIVKSADPEVLATQYAAKLNSVYDFKIPELDTDLSVWFKSTYINPARHGLMK